MPTTRNDSTRISSQDPQTPPRASDVATDPTRSVTGPIESMIRQIGIDKVYGSPITQGDTTVVPVAEVRSGFGFGSGYGHDAQDEGAGGGGGAALRIRPRGYLHITSDGVQYRPIYDVKTFIVGGAFVGWLLYRLFSR